MSIKAINVEPMSANITAMIGIKRFSLPGHEDGNGEPGVSFGDARHATKTENEHDQTDRTSYKNIYERKYRGVMMIEKWIFQQSR